MIKIALSGGDGVGKTTLANNLAKHFNLTRVSFATLIREELTTMYPKLDFFKKPTSKEIRLIMIKHSIAQKNKYGLDYYARHIFDNYANTPIVIDDMRFVAECDLARESNFKLFMLGEPNGYELSQFSKSTYRLPVFPSLDEVLPLCK